MKQSKLVTIIRPLLKKPFFSLKEAEKLGISRQSIANFLKNGVIKRISRGIYCSMEYETQVVFEWEHLVLIASTIPKGVICLVSALCYHDLTDQIMREAWIAVPYTSRPPKRPNTKIIRIRNTSLGKTKIKMGEYKVQIFDRERCVVDAFRHLSKEIALKALQKYLRSKGHKPDLQKLSKYAKILHVDLYPYILSYTT